MGALLALDRGGPRYPAEIVVESIAPERSARSSVGHVRANFRAR